MNNNQFISMLQDQLEEKTKSLSQIGEKRAAILEEEASLVKEVDAIKILVNAERKKLGLQEAEEILELQPEASSEVPEINVAQFVRDLISMNASNGIPLKGIKSQLKSAGITVHPNYPYNLVQRLIKNKKARQENGNIFPV